MFVVQRYTGDDAGKAHQDELLRKLQEKIKKKKAQKAHKADDDTDREEKAVVKEEQEDVKSDTPGDEQGREPPLKRKSKKRKAAQEKEEKEEEREDGVEEAEQKEEEGEEEVLPKKAKKKIAKKEQVGSGDEGDEIKESDGGSESESAQETPKKKAKNQKRESVREPQPKPKIMPKWMEHAVLIDTNLDDSSTPVDSLGLDPALISALNREKVSYFFPVQRQVIPLMMRTGRLPGVHPGDVCVSAPTGSGKTLAYVIPIVQCLLHRVVPRLRALVLLPTRDLALQVKRVFDAYTRKTDLKVATATGHTSFDKEQRLLVRKEEDGLYVSLADIVVATPGRLVDHLSSTPGFTLAHLRYLVIDEADRLLGQSYQDWLPKVLASSHSNQTSKPAPGEHVTSRGQLTSLTPAMNSHPQLPLQKLVFSATLSHNPEKLAALHLLRPHLVAASTGARYVIPARLQENIVVCSAGEKPLVLLHFLKTMGLRRVLCFTSSVDSSHRLYLLLKLYGGLEVAEYSSHLPQDQRHQMLESFRLDKTQILVCSDAMARGMDVDDVETVICYDPPAYIKTYVHRVGRTARAGRAGQAITILKSNEVRHFKLMHRKAEATQKLKQLTVKSDVLDPFEARLKDTLGELKAAVDFEKGKTGGDVADYLKRQLLLAATKDSQ